MVKDKGDRAQAKGESQVNEELRSPGHAQQGSILGVHWDQTVGVTDVNLGQESATAFLHNEIDSIIDPNVRKRELIAIDAVVDAVCGRV